MRLVLLGKTGSGKSATGNSILGRKFFSSRASQVSVTETCQKQEVERPSERITVVDTPGFLDTNKRRKSVYGQILKIFSEAAPGPHAFIIVLRTARFTQEEEDVLKEIENLFGDSLFKYSILLFPKEDDRNADCVDFSDFMKECPSTLKGLFAKCGQRVISFNNRATEEDNEKQVQKLLKIVREIMDKNNGTFYTHEVFQKFQKAKERQKVDKKKKIDRELSSYISNIELEFNKKFSQKVRNDREKLDYYNQMISKLNERLHSATATMEIEAIKEKIENYRVEKEKLSRKIMKTEQEKRIKTQKETEELFRLTKILIELDAKNRKLSKRRVVYLLIGKAVIAVVIVVGLIFHFTAH